MLQTPMQSLATRPAPSDSVPSSSPAFATPLPPKRATREATAAAAAPPARIDHETTTTRTSAVLPIILPPTTLRPIAFRTFTKKHSLTLTSSALEALAAFIGKNCGSAWREEGLAELTLEEVARMWKKGGNKVIVDSEGNALRDILKQLEGSMSGGRIVGGKNLSRQNSLVETPTGLLQRETSFGMSSLQVEDEEEEVEAKNPRSWIKVVNAFEQPRLVYNASRKHFEKSKSPASLFPPPAQKAELFRQRYHIAHQRLLRNESFQTSAVAQNSSTSPLQQAWKITPIANLLGRSGSGHLLLGLLTVAPTGTLAISDLTGSISLDLQQATPIDEIETWLCPGMIVLVDGVYEEEYDPAGGSLGNMSGIGGTIGGRFVGFQVGAPRCETRASTLGIADANKSDVNIAGGGFGWVDFLGLGSERAVGSRMRRLEQQLLHKGLVERRTHSSKIVIVGETTLDSPKTLEALKRILVTYSSDTTAPPLAFLVLGNFTQRAAMTGGSDGNSIDYKENLDALAALLAEFPSLLQSSTWVFVPGDNDPWGSSFSAGAASPLPQQPVPDLFTSRIRRVFASANAEVRANAQRVPGEAVWSTNPCRLSIFGPAQELVVFRDDVSGRLRRNCIPMPRRADAPATETETAAPASPAPTNHHDAPQTPSPPPADPDAMQLDNAEPIPIPHPDADMALNTTTATDKDKDAAADTNRDGETDADAATTARSITKTLLDQSTLSPFPLSLRPQHWSYAASALSLYPLPSALVLCDPHAPPWALTYQGCHVMNCGGVVDAASVTGRRARARAVGRWVEYDVCERRGVVREVGL